MKRSFDIIFSLSALVILSLPLIVIYIAILLTSSIPVIYWSNRVGKNKKIFNMPKFRSMRKITPLVPKDKLDSHYKWLTPLGSIIRRTSLDELPQLWCVLKGDMSLVGPRPALYNQYDLIELRDKFNINSIKPGITGWAQVNGRDKITLEEKVLFDEFYLKNRSLFLDFKIILMTIYKVIFFIGYEH